MQQIRIEPGPIHVESVRGTLTEDTLFCYINTREKGAVAITYDDHSVALYVGENTTQDDDEDIPMTHERTLVIFPDHFVVEVSEGRYCARVIGVRRPTEDGELLYVSPRGEDDAVEEPIPVPENG